MAYSYIRYTGNGSTTNYAFTFPYLDASHIKVRLNGTLTTLFTFLNASTIQLTSAPASGVVIEIRRETPKDNPIVNFTDGSVLLERDLDLLVAYDLYLAQETADIAGSVISQDSLGVWQAQNKRIANLADPVDAQDAVSKNWAETSMTSSLGVAVSSASTATTKASEASSSATAAAGSASAASSSQTAAATSASTATTQATNSANSASAAAASAAAALASQNSATSSAASATSSAASATTSAATATTQATNASNSASAAAASAASLNASQIVYKDSATGAAFIPSGTTAQRPSSPTAGYLRFNTTLGKPEVWNGSAWGSVGGGATGGGSDSVFQENSLVVTTSYTLSSGKNAVVVGPLSINSGVSVTVPTGQRLVIL